MTKDNLITLYKIIKENVEVIDEEIITNIKKMTDEDIELIKTSPYSMEIFELLSDEAFRDLLKEDQKKIIEIINNTREETVFYTCLIAATHYQNINLINYVSNAKGRHQAEDAYRIINDNDLSDEHLNEIIKIVTSQKDNQITYLIRRLLEEITNIDVSLKTNEINSESTIAIIKKIVNAKSVRQAGLGVDIAIDKRIRKNIIDNVKDIKEIVKYVSLVTSEKNPDKAETINKVLCDDDAIDSGISYELARIVKNAKGVGQAEYASNVAIDADVLQQCIKEDIIKLVKIVSQCETEYQAEYASYVACDLDVLTSNYTLELTDIVSRAKGEYQAEYSSQLAKSETLLQTSKILRLVKLASIIEDGKKISLSTNQIEYLIKDINNGVNNSTVYTPNELYKLFDVTENFWKLFKNNPDEAIELLNESITNPQEDINQNTKVKIKKR